MNTIYYVAASLDGYIADVNHGVEWLDHLEIDATQSDYDSFFASIDGLLMGRKTFDFVYDYGRWPYGAKPTWVCSTRPVPAMEGCKLQNEQKPALAIEKAKATGVTNLWVVGGGRLATSMIAAGQLTHFRVSIMPILLGEGIPLVVNLPAELRLRQSKSDSIAGYTQIEYELASQT